MAKKLVHKMSEFISRRNAQTGLNEWVLLPKDYDYLVEIGRAAYADMLHDHDRNARYYSAIKKVISKTKSMNKRAIVLDIGTGTGLLSMMAKRAGADEVYAVEAFLPMLECARKVIKRNGFTESPPHQLTCTGGDIKLIHKRSTQLIIGTDLPKCNILVTEVFDTELIGEGAIGTYNHAKNCLMEEGYMSVPHSAQTYIQYAFSQTIADFHILKGDKLMEHCPGIPSVQDLQLSNLKDYKLLTKPIPAFELNFTQNIPTTRSMDIQIQSLDQEGVTEGFIPGVLSEGIIPVGVLEGSITGGLTEGTIPGGRLKGSIPGGESKGPNNPGGVSTNRTNNDQTEGATKDSNPRGVATEGFHNPEDEPTQKFNTEATKNAPEGMSGLKTVGVANCAFFYWTLDMDGSGDNRLSCAPKWSDPKKYAWRDHWMQAVYYLPPLTNKLLFCHLEYDFYFGTTPPECECTVHLKISRNRIHSLNKQNHTPFLKLLNNFQNIVVISDDTLLPIEINKHFPDKNVIQWGRSFHPNIKAVLQQPILDDAVVIGEPHFQSTINGWDNVIFFHKAQQLGFEHVFPNSLTISVTPVYFEHLWKIKAPVRQTCGFILKDFDDLIMSSLNATDGQLDAQPLWEYDYKMVNPPTEILKLSYPLKTVENSGQIKMTTQNNGLIITTDWYMNEMKLPNTRINQDVMFLTENQINYKIKFNADNLQFNLTFQ